MRITIHGSGYLEKTDDGTLDIADKVKALMTPEQLERTRECLNEVITCLNKNLVRTEIVDEVEFKSEPLFTFKAISPAAGG